jgi:nucleoside-diphosphate-sugar epimerase
MRIAILGATSQIAKDLVRSFTAQKSYELVLYARRPNAVSLWLASIDLEGRYQVADFSEFSKDEHFDIILNFVGVGDPAQAVVMGTAIFDVTLHYDELALNYLRHHPQCRYIFLSSGAVYGSSFEAPADENTKAIIAINNLQPQDWYAIAKLYAESRHRSLAHMPIVDIRIFNYFSHTQDIETRFLITDIVRAMRDKTVLKTSSAYMMRDYLHPSDLHKLIEAILTSQATNLAVDCYSKEPVEKSALLKGLQQRFGLEYEAVQTADVINATGVKPCYYSLNRQAEQFGYAPQLTSLAGIFLEIKEMLLQSKLTNRTFK